MQLPAALPHAPSFILHKAPHALLLQRVPAVEQAAAHAHVAQLSGLAPARSGEGLGHLRKRNGCGKAGGGIGRLHQLTTAVPAGLLLPCRRSCPARPTASLPGSSALFTL